MTFCWLPRRSETIYLTAVLSPRDKEQAVSSLGSVGPPDRDIGCLTAARFCLDGDGSVACESAELTPLDFLCNLSKLLLQVGEEDNCLFVRCRTSVFSFSSGLVWVSIIYRICYVQRSFVPPLAHSMRHQHQLSNGSSDLRAKHRSSIMERSKNEECCPEKHRSCPLMQLSPPHTYFGIYQPHQVQA